MFGGVPAVCSFHNFADLVDLSYVFPRCCNDLDLLLEFIEQVNLSVLSRRSCREVMEVNFVLVLESSSRDSSNGVVVDGLVQEAGSELGNTLQLQLDLVDLLFIEVEHGHMKCHLLKHVVEHHFLEVVIHRNLEVSNVTTPVVSIDIDFVITTELRQDLLIFYQQVACTV